MLRASLSETSGKVGSRLNMQHMSMICPCRNCCVYVVVNDDFVKALLLELFFHCHSSYICRILAGIVTGFESVTP